MTVASDSAGGAPFLGPRGSWLQALGFEITKISGTEVIGHVEVTPDHHTPFKMAQGGLFTTLVESAASYGASAAVADRGQFAVGVNNSTDFLRPVSSGRLDVVASPVYQGRIQQLWTVDITRHGDGQLVAQGRLRLQNVPIPDNGL
jgi:uncharacterized protein (TIGR00369 family)